MDVKTIALKIARRDFPACDVHAVVSAIEESIESYKAELLKEVGEPVVVLQADDFGWGIHTDSLENSSSGSLINLYTSDQLAAAILKATGPLEEEIERLRADNIAFARNLKGKSATTGATYEHICTQLAAEQLNNKLLRDALQEYIDEHEECQDADDWMAMMCSMEAHHTADEALSQPSDTSALDTFVAEKVKEIIESHAPEGRNVTNAQHVEMRHKFVEQIATLTQQRDLAVSELKTVANGFDCDDDAHRYGSYCRKCEAKKALSTIKESEAQQCR